jgi:hypothetical protein
MITDRMLRYTGNRPKVFAGLAAPLSVKPGDEYKCPSEMADRLIATGEFEDVKPRAAPAPARPKKEMTDDGES